MLHDGQPVDVVVLVGPAGGLDAFTTVLRALGPELPVPIVLQQHLGGQASILPTILARRTDWTVVWAQDGSTLESGRVVVCPARSQVEVLPDRTFAVSGLAPSGARPHDALLTSLADSVGVGAVAVVLTGSGSDGAAGVAALKAAGGIVIAQSEDTAEYPAMPAAAAHAGADLVLPLHEIGTVIADVVRGEPLPRPEAELDALRAVFGDEGRIAAFAREIALLEETADRTWASVERCRAEMELRESEERFRTLADTTPALIRHIAEAGVNRFVNQRYLDITGLPPEEAGRESWHELLHPDDAADHVAALHAGAAEHRGWRARSRVRRHDGVYRELETHAAPLFDDDGTYVGQVGISFDVAGAGSAFG